MLVRIDTTSAEPIYGQIAREIRSAMGSGRLSPGSRLPAARELARSLDVNMHTVLRAYAELREAGDIELRRGRGAIVLPRTQRDAELGAAIEALLTIGRRQGLTMQQLHQALEEGAGR